MAPLLIAMFSFLLAMSISPGPVNMIILSSGVNHGVRKTVPYITGATVGFTLLLLFIGFGLSQFVQSNPFLLDYLTVLGSIYIIYIGYKISSTNKEIQITKKSSAPKLYEGFLMQWVNPKAWIACISGASIFSSPNYEQLLIFSGIYFLVCYGSLAMWAVMGARISSFLKNSHHLKWFNWIMGSLLVLTAGLLSCSQLFQG